MKSAACSFLVSAAAHFGVLAIALFLSIKPHENAALDVAPALSDPLLAMLAPPNADPTRAAGIVGEKPGVAEGEPDAPLQHDFSEQMETMEELMKASDDALAQPLPEPEPVPAEPAEAVPAEAKPAEPAEAKPSPKKSTKKAADTSKKSVEKSTPAKKMSLEEFRRKNKKNTDAAARKKAAADAAKKKGVSAGTVTKIDVGKIGIGGGNGKSFGAAGGTGGNGGEGGSAVASAQQAYAAEVAQNLARHLDDVLARAPLKLGASVVVAVRLGIDSVGNVRLLEVLGSSDAQVRDRVAKAVARIGKFRAPPQNQAFEMRIPEVVLRPL